MSQDQCHRPQTHVHEVQGSVQIAEENIDAHNHRFATVSDEVVECRNGDHYHIVKFRTDFYEDHFHKFVGATGGAIPICDGRHVHFLKDVTEVSDCHVHEFRVATLINDPIGEE